ncbi:GDSL esterase/lipase At5g08460-like [Lycium barbarum]|uniref:GDSL esterase/lipase At5g08460-like n=1 Tax=Lycium barbarum TaxID=112863 RepID=UPI00293E1E15|nr:GDSL esterase/lipase At5g08460-like [Lycium barbarum]
MAWKVLFLCNLALFVFLSFEEATADDEPQFTALFVFGDSLMDPGNNNYLANSLAKANYVPYGVDFQGPTGRFCNGRTIIDYLGDLLGLPLIPAYTATITLGCDISKGVNYASVAAEILDETCQSLAEYNHDSIFVYGNTFGGFTHIFNNASAYGKENILLI